MTATHQHINKQHPLVRDVKPDVGPDVITRPDDKSDDNSETHKTHKTYTPAVLPRGSRALGFWEQHYATLGKESCHLHLFARQRTPALGSH